MGFSCGIFIDPSGSEWNDFLYTTNERVTAMNGKLTLVIGSEGIVAEPNDEVCTAKGIHHSSKNVSYSTTRWLYGYD